MAFPKIKQEDLGRAYLAGFVITVLALAFGGLLFSIAGPALLVWAFVSDDDDLNHIDPPGTTYMDREGKPVGGMEGEAIK